MGAANSGSASPKENHFDGMESWLPWLVGDSHGGTVHALITDVLPEDAKIVLIEPRRMRDRATDLIAEEDDLAPHTRLHLGSRPPTRRSPRLHAEPDVLLSAAGSFWSIDSTPRLTRHPIRRGDGVGASGR